jgi:long-chain acyl-CoA synthetase
MFHNQKIRLVQDILKKNRLERPDKVALICENQRLTYSQIDLMSDRLANAFHKNGIQEGDRILLYLLNSSEMVVSIFAALKANAIFSVIDYANTFDTLLYIATDCQATALVTHDLQAESAARLMRELDSLRFAILTGQNVLPSAPRLLSFNAIQDNYPPDAPAERVIDRDLAYLLYTSGSTGQARGVMTTHSSSLFTAESGIEYFGLTEHDVLASPLPLSFSPGMNQLLKIFRVGGTLILEKSFAYPTMTLERITREGATALAGVPAILAILLQKDLSHYDLRKLRYVSSVGSVLTPSTIQQFRSKFPGISLYSFYGMAEAAYSLGLEPEQIDQHPASVGKPFPGTQAWIVGDDGQRLQPDQIGELVVRGGHVRCGYWNNAKASAQRFRPGLFPGELVCFTGDMFRMDTEGYFYFVGRNDEIIKSGAKKIALKEIENILYSLPGVLEAAAVGISDPILGQVIKVFVVLDEKARAVLTVQDISSYCHQKLEVFKVPRQIEIKESLPKTPSGKIKKPNMV